MSLDADGDFVIAWDSGASFGNDDDLASVQARRYSSDGTPLGPEFQVNTYTTGVQGYPSVSLDADGDFVVAWQSFGSSETDHAGFSIQARRYDSDGAPQDGGFQVNTYTSGDQEDPSVSLDAAGDFVVSWKSAGSTGTDDDSFSIQLRRFRADGTPYEVEEQVNSFTANEQQSPSVSVAAGGRFIVTWESRGSSGNDDSSLSIQRSDPGVLPIFTDGFETGGFTAWSGCAGVGCPI